MRTWAIILLLLAAIISLDILASRQIEEAVGRMSDMADELASAVENGDWERADAAGERLLSEWENVSRRLQKFLDHSELESVDIVITRVKALLAARDKAGLVPELSEMARDIGHLTERYELALENIF